MLPHRRLHNLQRGAKVNLRLGRCEPVDLMRRTQLNLNTRNERKRKAKDGCAAAFPVNRYRCRLVFGGVRFSSATNRMGRMRADRSWPMGDSTPKWHSNVSWNRLFRSEMKRKWPLRADECERNFLFPRTGPESEREGEWKKK